MYGTYTEPKFDALGLSFRVENLVARLLEDLVAEGADSYVTRDSLRRMAAAIRRFERALAVDGVDSRSLAANLRLLEASFSSHNFTFHQYQNVFQFLVGSVTELSRTSILSHDQVLHTVLEHDPRQCEARCMSIDAVAEMVLREVLVSALGMQALDRYVSAALRQISTLTGRLSNHALTRMMNYDPERLVSPIHEAKAQHRRSDDAWASRDWGSSRWPPTAPGAGRLHPHHRVVQRLAGHVVPAALRRHHRAHPQPRSSTWRSRPGYAWATPTACSPCRSDRVRPSPCRGS